MKRIYGILVASIISLFFVRCKKDNSSGSETNPQSYSGNWKGTIQVTDKNPDWCYFAGDPMTVVQNWMVTPDDSLKIDEKYYANGSTTPTYWTWIGVIRHGDSIIITSLRPINCSGTYKDLTVNLRAKIIKKDSNYSVKASVDYPMCPPDCLFIFNYSMTKE